MDAVILAGGEGKRLRPITYTRPKCLTYVGTETILERDIKLLKKVGVDRIFVVVKHKKEKIEEFVKEKKLDIILVEQIDAYGTWSALKSVETQLKNDFLVMAGDDIYFLEDIRKIAEQVNTIGCKESDKPENFGVILENNGKVDKVLEKQKNPPSKLVNTSLYHFEKEVFKKKVNKSVRGEYEITDVLNGMEIIRINDWVPISYPWDLFHAHEKLLKQIKEYNHGEINNCTIKNAKIIVENGAKITNSYFDGGMHYIGKNAKIGPNTYLRGNNFIGENCEIGFGTTIKNSIIFPNTKAKHLNYIGDSVVGEYVNFGAGTQIANFRFDGKDIKVLCDTGFIDTKSRKIGAFIGDHTKFGILSGVMPGRIIGNNCWIGAGKIISKKVPPNSKII